MMSRLQSGVSACIWKYIHSIIHRNSNNTAQTYVNSGLRKSETAQCLNQTSKRSQNLIFIRSNSQLALFKQMTCYEFLLFSQKAFQVLNDDACVYDVYYMRHIIYILYAA